MINSTVGLRQYIFVQYTRKTQIGYIGMRSTLVLTIFLLQVINISSLTENFQEISLSQQKCEFYQNMFNWTAEGFPFLIRIYNGYYYNAKLLIENKVDFLNGVIISENYVLTIANNRTQNPLIVEVSNMKLEVIQTFTNEQQNIALLRLSESVEFGDHIRPVCLPQTDSIIFSQIICWVDGSWVNRLRLKFAPRGSCQRNSEYVIRLWMAGAHNKSKSCINVKDGDRDRCNASGSILLNDKQEVIGIATESSSESQQVTEFRSVPPLQIFVQLSEHVAWIENIVWNSNRATSTTIATEETSELPVENGNASSTNVIDFTTENTPHSTKTKPLSRIDVELHDIHIFLNVNLILIVVILFIVLCISTILWSDGLCIQAAIPDQFTTSTDV